jgi:hypothetical protein
MPDNPQPQKKSINPDWFVHGALTRIGDIVDKLTGRSWKPASSLATSGLIERMKTLLEREIKLDDEGRKFVPHNITLKMQWDKFSTDSEQSLKKLEGEMLTAAVDFISDNRFYTHAPLKLEVKPDYFTEGVKLFVSFDAFGGDEAEPERELNVTMPHANVKDLIPEEYRDVDIAELPRGGQLVVKYDAGSKPMTRTFMMTPGKRLTVGRTKENNVAIDHTSVSKLHASLLLNSEGKLVVADTGSTNGTYLNGERIAYGKAIEIFEGDKLKFGAIDVDLNYTPAPPPEPQVSPDAKTEAYTVGDMQFSPKKTQVVEPAVKGDLLEEEDKSSPPG